MIKFDNVTFGYGKESVLKDFNLEIKDNESVCLFAPSGFGKTTVLRLIMGLERVKSGNIEGIRDKKISVVFQEDRLLSHKTVLENVELFGGSENSVEILKGLNISGAKDLYPSDLSGGMARRTAIARALNHEADIYIFDEPFNGIDNENIEKTARLILEKTKDKTLIMVTHNLYEAKLLNARIIDL